MTVSSCGCLVVGGFSGTSLPSAFARALAEGRRGGAILFRRNIDGPPHQVAALARSIHAAAGGVTFIGIDQEGGRVARLSAPLLEVPSMREVGSWGDVDLAERIARMVGQQLAALGFTIDFAPVLDVDTCPVNPIIGDRAFGKTAEICASFGVAWTRGLESSGLLACGKHFPGHGDTSKDSHIELPVVDQPIERLERVELNPFRAAAAAGIASMMTAHVVYPALDRSAPATLSRAVCTDLRERIGFRGWLLSDDLEMRAIAEHGSIEDAAIGAIDAGCDALLICGCDEVQDRAVEALTREARRSAPFRMRCEQAYERGRAARRRIVARPAPNADISRIIGADEATLMADEIARRMGR